jgi:outer membrane lipoprotein-sorting protein
VPEGPPEAIVALTLAALEAKANLDRIPLTRRRTMLMTMKIAAAALVTAGGWFYFAVAPSTEATAFGEAVQKLRDAHTLTYRTTMESPELKAPMTMRMFVKEPSLMRTEAVGGIVTVVDGRQGKQLILDPTSKTALLLEGKAPEAPSGPATSFAERLRQLTEGDAKPVGEKVIGGVRALGYRVEKLGMEMTVWVDATTRLPIRIESSDRIQGKEFRAIASDFQIDPAIDDALFRLDPPPGYTLRKAASNLLEMDEKTFLNPEKAAEALLRIFAEKSRGTFPKRLDVFTEFDTMFPKKTGAIPDPETLRAVQSLTRFLMATRQLKGGFGYKSDGVKLGDADKILFWYRSEGAAKYRVLYGDLHVSDVSEDGLPEKPKP